MEIDLGPLLRQAVSAHLTQFKEEIRALQERAWAEGYHACREGNQQFRNPYRPESPDDEALDRKNLG